MKKEMRKNFLKKRNALTTDDVNMKSKQIFYNLSSLPEYKNANNVMVYLDFRKEVKTKYIIEDLFLNKKNVIVPISKVKTKELLLSKINSFDDLTISTYGILEPKSEKIDIVSPEIIDIILVPGVVFDKKGYRIGYGAGYYDKFLSNLSHNFTAIGLSYELQLVDKIPKDKHDYQLDFIITEEKIIKTKKDRE
ncbi:5-formyltetrahydrofolate cyclo-ligase [Caminicella sporogenes]|uniref:5-formyltetrahydrofolate cyclo-ligase n=1 Tax=Caminicella sporogenes TaxID=166485 RepID=UPI002540A26C|nr:5-formyltetrahydrofolate cyclo-ligase [Caminicella sporogenes]WIF95299.1 5-formyltetrahydrofolate cyclo-ligase [Caminicella sporogenes]